MQADPSLSFSSRVSSLQWTQHLSLKLFFPFSFLYFVYLHCEAARVLKVTASSRWNPRLLDQQLPCFQTFYISLKCYLRFSVFWIKLTFKKRGNIPSLLTFGNDIGFRQYCLPPFHLLSSSTVPRLLFSLTSDVSNCWPKHQTPETLL